MAGGQSYPISLTLVIYRSGKIIHRFSDGLMIYNWTFRKGGQQVAFGSGPTHGQLDPVHFELRDTNTGKLVSERWRGKGPLPVWARQLCDNADCGGAPQ